MRGDGLRGWVDKVRDSDVAKTIGERGRDLGRDLGLDEIDTLVRRDTAKAYTFYDPEGSPDLPKKGLRRGAAISKALFLNFLKKLSPARRLTYTLALLAFGWGFWEGDWGAATLGFLTINFLLALELAEKLLTKDELEIARTIQFSLYPATNPKLQNLEVASFFQPAQDVGGDYYDFALDGSRRFTVILGDVSGKGIPAALYAMKLQALFELLGKGSVGPKEMLVEMNDVISERIERNYFITAVVGMLDLHDQRLVLARAGHNHPLHYSAQQKSTRWLKPSGMGIGMKTGAGFDGVLEETRLSLDTGDVILFYTDGVSEAMNEHNEPFGYDKLETVVKANAHLPATEIKNRLLSELDTFRAGTPYADDVTLVVTKVV